MTILQASVHDLQINITLHVAQSCYNVIGDKPFLWSKPKFDPPYVSKRLLKQYITNLTNQHYIT